MKFFKSLFAFCALSLALVSCTKEGDDVLSESKLVGKWKAVELSTTYYADGERLESYTEYFADYSRYFQFYEDGTGQELYTEGTYSETYAIKAWLLMENELILTYEEDYYNEKYVVESLTSDTMQLSVIVEENIEGVKVKGELKYTYTKI